MQSAVYPFLPNKGQKYMSASNLGLVRGADFLQNYQKYPAICRLLCKKPPLSIVKQDPQKSIGFAISAQNSQEEMIEARYVFFVVSQTQF